MRAQKACPVKFYGCLLTPSKRRHPGRQKFREPKPFLWDDHVFQIAPEQAEIKRTTTPMLFYVQFMNDPTAPRVLVDVKDCASVAACKMWVEKQCNVLIKRLFFAGRILDVQRALNEYPVEKESVVLAQVAAPAPPRPVPSPPQDEELKAIESAGVRLTQCSTCGFAFELAAPAVTARCLQCHAAVCSRCSPSPCSCPPPDTYMRKPASTDLVGPEEEEAHCFVCLESVKASESVTLPHCGHKLHLMCLSAQIDAAKLGGTAPLSFRAFQCGLCSVWLCHPRLNLLLPPHTQLRVTLALKLSAAVRCHAGRLAKRLKEKDSETSLGSVLERHAFFQCSRCSRVFHGGLRQCHEQLQPTQAPLCEKCSAQHGECRAKKKHVFAWVWKCSQCCGVARWNCGGTRYCHYCHDGVGDQFGECPDPTTGRCPGGWALGTHERTKQKVMRCSLCTSGKCCDKRCTNTQSARCAGGTCSQHCGDKHCTNKWHAKAARKAARMRRRVA